jgi:hypothetical protein
LRARLQSRMIPLVVATLAVRRGTSGGEVHLGPTSCCG